MYGWETHVEGVYGRMLPLPRSTKDSIFTMGGVRMGNIGRFRACCFNARTLESLRNGNAE